MHQSKSWNFLIAFTLFVASFSIISCGGENKDPAIQTKISALTQTTPELQNVSASVSNGVVTLIGNCSTDKDRERAEKAVKKIDDVKDVINNITITENVEVTSDSNLRDQAAEVLKKHKHVQAEVNGGIITLRGTVDKDELKQMMTELNALRPRRIENQLVVE